MPTGAPDRQHLKQAFPKLRFEENQPILLDRLIALYEDVGWAAYSENPEKVQEAFRNALYHIAAWNHDCLAGIIRVVGDGASIIYIQDLLVLRKYQRCGIGSELLQRVLTRYASIRQIVLLTDEDPETVAFYRKNGMLPIADFQGLAFVRYNLNV